MARGRAPAAKGRAGPRTNEGSFGSRRGRGTRSVWGLGEGFRVSVSGGARPRLLAGAAAVDFDGAISMNGARASVSTVEDGNGQLMVELQHVVL